MDTHRSLVDHLINSGVLQTPQIIDAFFHVDRSDFVSHDRSVSEIYGDHPLSIGYGQTISQPSTVAFMLELLQPFFGDKILDVGSGSGWTTALMASIVGVDGTVYGMDIVPDLVKIGRANLLKYQFKNASILYTSDEYGLSAFAPYDKILVSAAGSEIPRVLIDQLAVDGTMVIPIHDDLIRYRKRNGEKDEIEYYHGFSFVPLIDPMKSG
jgi:protein-L-isoaspartate(D-aspartate) O-methyltransferase